MDTFKLLCYVCIMFSGIHGMTFMRWNPLNPIVTAMLAFFAIWPGTWLALLIGQNVSGYAGILNIILPIGGVIIVQVIYRRLACRYMQGDADSFIWY